MTAHPVRIAVLVLTALAGCVDGAPGLACRQTTDCQVFGPTLECTSENDLPGCGVPPQEACLVDDDCDQNGARRVCDTRSERDVGCGRGTTCVVACTNDSCSGGEACNEQSGLCEPTSCLDDATVCRSTERCAPNGEGAERNGCLLRSCSRDDDCGDGDVCVTGHCSSGPGLCAEVVIAP